MCSSLLLPRPAHHTPALLRCPPLPHPPHAVPPLPLLQPLLEKLLEEFQGLYPGIQFPPLPPKGELDLDKLKEATYFFS